MTNFRQMEVISRRLSCLVTKPDFSELDEYLASLNNASFRIAGKVLAESVLTTLSGDSFWRVFSHLSLLNPKAYLGTCLKAAKVLYERGDIVFSGNILEDYAATVVSKSMLIDRDKFLRAVLPLLKKDKEFADIWRMFAVEASKTRIDYLLRCSTLTSCYEIFKEAKRLQDDLDYLKKICYVLIKRGDNISFNLASIMRSYFAIKDIDCLFSLKLEPYQLSYLDSSQENFEKLLGSI